MKEALYVPSGLLGFMLKVFITGARRCEKTAAKPSYDLEHNSYTYTAVLSSSPSKPSAAAAGD